MGLTPRERVLYALNHEEPDRVPLFVGTSGVTSVLGPGYDRLRAHLGIGGGAIRWLSRHFQYTWMDEEVLVRLGSDGRALVPGPAQSTLRKDVSDDCLIDDWGVTWRRAPRSLYFEIADAPLRNATIDDLEHYPWPILTSPARLTGLAESARAIQDAGFATVLLPGFTLFEQACVMRGLDALLRDVAADEDFVTALLVKLKSLVLPYIRAILGHVGPWVDVLVTGDDLGMMSGPMLSPRTYRRLIKPHHADCGGIDTQWVMPRGTPEDVRKEVRRRIQDLGPGGGYVAAAVHCIQPDVPPENIVAMCEEVVVSGRYPLQR